MTDKTFDPRQLARGAPVLVKTSFGWQDGRFYQYLPFAGEGGMVQIEIEKTRRGRRSFLPEGAKLIWPHAGTYGVVVPPTMNYVRPSDTRQKEYS
jgi:hypothetical protein